MALLELDQVTLRFAGVTALSQVNLRVEPGELLAVIGPNGAGKTSLYNCISGVYQPQEGSIRFEDRDLGVEPTHRRAALGIARMFQNLALYEHLTVLENLLVGRHHLYRLGWWHKALWTRRARDEEVAHRARAEQIIDFLDLERYRKFPAGMLPYGVLKRVELGRALCMEPRLLLLDEPAAGLNQEESEDMARYVLDLKEDLGMTQVLIEHDLGMVMDLADRVVVLDFGRVICEGTPAEVREHPAVLEAYMGGVADSQGSDTDTVQS